MCLYGRAPALAPHCHMILHFGLGMTALKVCRCYAVLVLYVIHLQIQVPSAVSEEKRTPENHNSDRAVIASSALDTSCAHTCIADTRHSDWLPAACGLYDANMMKPHTNESVVGSTSPIQQPCHAH